VQILRFLFADPFNIAGWQHVSWPRMMDGRHGRVKGLRFLPTYRSESACVRALRMRAAE
jgi:hypothetical protein